MTHPFTSVAAVAASDKKLTSETEAEDIRLVNDTDYFIIFAINMSTLYHGNVIQLYPLLYL